MMEVEQLLTLSGSALAQAVSSLLESPGLYVFSDILELPNVKELENGPHAPVYQLLNLFAYGTYCDYKERAASLPELTPAQKNKLRHLSIISLASNLKCLPYSLLLQQLELKNVRELEDLLIEAVYCDIIQGKLDQRNQQVEVDCSVGRDLGPNELPNIINTLQEWCTGCEAVLCGIEEQVSRANQYRESQLKVKVQVETERGRACCYRPTIPEMQKFNRQVFKVKRVAQTAQGEEPSTSTESEADGFWSSEQARKYTAEKTSSGPVAKIVVTTLMIFMPVMDVSNLQKTLKASAASPSSGPAPAGAASNQDADQPAEPRDPASSQEPRQPGKKSSKVKGLRGSGKIWSKSN
ncbi:COP9 signalosome complex subunit 7a isoform 1-T1 [Synchiropus picturatus]